MAHYARIGIDNKVITVDLVDNINCMTPGGIERDDIAIAHLQSIHGAGNWVKCSYNTMGGIHRLGGTPLRANFPGGVNEDDPYYYDSTNDIFYRKRPSDEDGDLMNSWTLNTTTGRWEPPLVEPETTREQTTSNQYYTWDESAYQADNTTGWVLRTAS